MGGASGNRNPRAGKVSILQGQPRPDNNNIWPQPSETPLERYSREQQPGAIGQTVRSHLRTVAVLAAAAALVVLFLHNVNLWGVIGDIAHARPEWLALSLATMFLNLVIRSWRWQYLLEPLGPTTFANAFRATAVGFAATSVLPARAGEVIRPYFLARHERMSATAAFATIVLERLLDIVTVLVLLASFVFVFGRDWTAANPVAFTAVKWAGVLAGTGAGAALVVLFLLAGNPAGLRRALARLE